MRIFVLFLLLLALIAPALAYQSAEPFFRTPNITIFYPKTPWALLGITPKFENPQLFRYDYFTPPPAPPRLDPRTCPNEIAICYRVLEHNFTGEITAGKNYTATSTYILPERRIKTFVCVGDDLACVATSTNCYCPDIQLPAAPYIIPGKRTCSDQSHLCRSSYAGLTLCQGNVSACSEQHLACGCGRHSTCLASTLNTCINDRNELFMCRSKLADCLAKYETCFCGIEALELQRGCTRATHACRDGNREVTCKGSFADCALKYETCEC